VRVRPEGFDGEDIARQFKRKLPLRGNFRLDYWGGKSVH
jgi:hypothetical protein